MVGVAGGPGRGPLAQGLGDGGRLRLQLACSAWNSSLRASTSPRSRSCSATSPAATSRTALWASRADLQPVALAATTSRWPTASSRDRCSCSFRSLTWLRRRSLSAMTSAWLPTTALRYERRVTSSSMLPDPSSIPA